MSQIIAIVQDNGIYGLQFEPIEEFDACLQACQVKIILNLDGVRIQLEAKH